MEAAKLCLAAIANVELVSLLIVIFTLVFKKKTFWIVLLFVMMEGLLYGFGIWWIMYLYIWPLLVLLTLIFQSFQSTCVWAIILGLYGLFFGALCSIPYFIIGGMGGGISYWISGIPFDIIHCVSNVTLTLILFKPLLILLRRLERTSYFS